MCKGRWPQEKERVETRQISAGVLENYSRKETEKDKTHSVALLDHIKLEAMEINIKINICVTPAANQAMLLGTSDSFSYYCCPSVLSWQRLRLAAQTIQGTSCGLNVCSARHYHACIRLVLSQF